MRMGESENKFKWEEEDSELREKERAKKTFKPSNPELGMSPYPLPPSTESGPPTALL